jgi:serine/threonine protein kinase
VAELPVGAVFAGHRIESIAGRGGMGVVYVASHVRLKQRRALKVITSEFSHDVSFRRRFERESEVAASIDHPHVVPIYDAGEADGLLYIAMRFVDGSDLKSEIDRLGTVDPHLTCQILSQVASALDVAHEAGLVHRDVKPANILLAANGASPSAYLSDFGLTKLAEAETSGITASGAVVGTLDYIAPEQLEGRLDRRSDVYALGCVLVHALTGRVPFPELHAAAKMWAHFNAAAPRITDSNPALPTAVNDVAFKAMAKHPDDRYQSAGALAEALASALDPRAATAPRARPVVSSDSSSPKSSTPMPSARVDPSPAEKTRSRVIGVRAALIAAIACLAIVGTTVGLLLSRKSSGANDATLGFPTLATRNTTRVPGADPVADAASVASALFPAASPESRPSALLLVDKNDWQGAVAGGALVSAPIGAPILLSDGGHTPRVTADTMARLKPTGSQLASGAQVILIGNKPSPPAGFKVSRIVGADQYSVAAAVDRFLTAARGRATPDVLVASGEAAAYSAPAGAFAARAGVPVLFTRKDSLPPATVAALKRHGTPNIYVLGPSTIVSTAIVNQLSRFGRVKRIQGATPVENAINFARYKHGGFGWGAGVPGQNFTIARASRPGDTAAAAGLGANGIFSLMLLTDGSDLPRQVESYLLDQQPGYANGDPSQGVYNHVWILGGPQVISRATQDRLDTIAALVPVDRQPHR